MALVQRKKQILTRREMLLTLGMTTPFSILCARLYALQILGGQKYKRLSDKNQFSMRLILPERGVIYDQNSTALAVNRKTFRLVLIPEQAHQPRELLRRLAELIDLTPAQQQDTLRRLKHVSPFAALSVREHLTFDEMALIEYHLPNLPGVDVEENLIRYYPYGDMFAHVLGYTALPDEDDLQNQDDPLLSLPDFRLGRRGIEAMDDVSLRGKAGSNQVEVNALGREVQVVSTQPAQKGDPLKTSLVLEVQKAAWDGLQKNGASGAVVAIDIHSGEVLALASSPSFDPNTFVMGIDAKTWASLNTDPGLPLMDRATLGQYAPGSTYKPLVAVAALTEGVTTPEERIYCNGELAFGDRVFHCWKKGGHGHVNMDGALVGSCDVYFYTMGQRLGIDAMSRYATLFGLGASTGIGLPEQNGLVPTRAWKKRVKHEPWVAGEDLIHAIGQGYTLLTPLQLAQYTARMASGKLVQPRLEANGVADFTAMPIPPENIALVRGYMDDVVNDIYGTGHRAYSRKYRLAGKTGTSQVVSINRSERMKLSDIPEKQRTNALFIGFGPVEAPRVATAVILEHAGGGGANAAPIARDTMVAALDWMNGNGKKA